MGGVWKSRAVAVGLVFAAAGFCYAVSTYDSAEPGAASRGVGTGTPLRFTNPLLRNPGGVSIVGEYDLGDACFGSTITRYINAEGGLKPYRFTSVGTLALMNVIEGFNTTLQLGISGVLAGSLPPRPVDANKQPQPFPSKMLFGNDGFRFEVTVTDARGTAEVARTARFNLFLVDCRDILRFAMDRLPDGRVAASYLSRIEVIGGRVPLTFSLLSVTGAGGAAVTPEDLGLFVTSEGSVIGRPLQAGTFVLKVRCVDNRRQIALSRNETVQDQDFPVTILDEPVTSSDLTTLDCRVRGDQREENRDSLKYKAFINALGTDNFDLLNSDFSFRLGGVGFAVRLDKKGQFNGQLADKSKVKVKVSTTKGTVDVSIKNGTFSAGLEASKLKPGLTRKAVQVTLGEAVASSEVLDFDTDIAGTRFALNYGFARQGSSAAGGFQITSVKGRDASTLSGQPGDVWRAGFVALPRTAVKDPLGRKQGLTGITGATVRIGTNFTQALTSARLRVSAQAASFHGVSTDGIKRFTLSTSRFTGKVDTNVLSFKTTGIPAAINAPAFGATFFPMGIDLVRGGDAPFTGEHARRIFGLKNQYKDVPPKR